MSLLKTSRPMEKVDWKGALTGWKVIFLVGSVLCSLLRITSLFVEELSVLDHITATGAGLFLVLYLWAAGAFGSRGSPDN